MSEVTERDREVAHALWNELLCNGEVPGWSALDAIAAALAAERARALAPVLAICEAYDDGRLWSAQAADRIREAIAQDPPC